MAGDQTLGELYKAQVIPDADLDAAVAAYITDSKTTEFVFAGGYRLNLMVAVRGQASARKLMKDPDSSQALKHAVVRRAILLSKAVRG